VEVNAAVTEVLASTTPIKSDPDPNLSLMKEGK
jgi:hypothetical protein